MLLLLAACLCSASVGACLGFAIASMLAVAKASDKASERIAVMGAPAPTPRRKPAYRPSSAPGANVIARAHLPTPPAGSVNRQSASARPSAIATRAPAVSS
jgi:hypothetical protein